MFLKSHWEGLRRSRQKHIGLCSPCLVSASIYYPALAWQRAGTGKQRTDITQMHASGGSWGNWGKLW